MEVVVFFPPNRSFQLPVPIASLSLPFKPFLLPGWAYKTGGDEKG